MSDLVVSCLQKSLRAATVAVKPTVPKHPTLPILTHFLVEGKEGRLVLTATDLDYWVSYEVGCRLEQEGAIAVPAREFVNLVDSLPNDRVDIQVQGEKLSLHCEEAEITLLGKSAKDFPPRPMVDGSVLSTQVHPSVLRNAIHQVEPFASKDYSRPVLTAVCLDFEEETLAMATADGFRLARCHLPLSVPVVGPKATRLLVPVAALRQLYRLLAKQEHPVDVESDGKMASFSTGAVCTGTRLVSGSYPNYEQLIPSACSTQVTVVQQALMDAVKSAWSIARETGNAIRLEVIGKDGGWGLKVGVQSEDQLFSTTIAIRLVGKEGKIAFDGRYLLDILGRINTELVSLEWLSPNSPGVFRPEGTVGGKGDYPHDSLYVCMPMFVRW